MAENKIIKQGYLVKKGAKRKNWKTRWFILRGRKLEYYADPMDSKPKGVVDLDDTCNVETANAQAKPNAFQINTKERIFYISAGNATLRDQWISAIKEIVNV